VAADRVLIVNADDFGFTRDVNAGIIEAHLNGILTATTLMANGEAFEDAVALAKKHPSLDIGCHLVLVGGRFVSEPERSLPRNLKELLGALARGRVPVEHELDRQVARIVDAGLRPTHLDTHKHTHLLPPVLEVVARLSRKYGIPWVRRPFDYPMHAGAVPLSRRLLSRSLDFLRRRFHRILSSHGCRTTDHFAGFGLTGYLRTRELIELLGQLPPGSTEFMTHPGYCTGELRGASTRLKESREAELNALTAPQTREALQDMGIRLANYRDLPV
jgi:predicted glycoside hydrolase/deacetylase ChbG (UPF0249 family)